MRVLVFGDPHFRATNEAQTQALTRWTRAFFTESEAPRVDAAVVLGDILHNHDRIDVHSLTRAIEFLSTLHAGLRGRPMWVLIGNHDRPNNMCYLTEEHAFTAIKSWDNVVVADDEAKVVSAGGKRFVLVPYVPNGKFGNAIAPLVASGDLAAATAVFAHQEFRGCKLGTTVSKNGDIYPIEHPLCISGHIHDYSSPQKNIIYVGTPFETSWTQKGTRGPVLVDFSGEPVLHRMPITSPVDTVITVRPADLPSLLESGVKTSRVKLVCSSANEYQAVKASDAFAQIKKRSSITVKVEHQHTEAIKIAKSALAPFAVRINGVLKDAPDGVASVIRKTFQFL